ncbi:MAG: hypothetical protein QM804_10695 [Propionicimonas sp.]
MTPHQDATDRLRAGGLSARLIDQDLRNLQWDGEEFGNRIYLAVRDPAWATLPARVEVTRQTPDALEWTAHYLLDGSDLAIQASLSLSPDELVCAMTATADGPVRYNRIGWCLLLPLSLAGAPAAYTDASGNQHATELPDLIAPQPLGPTGPEPAIGPFRRFEYSGERATYHLDTTGDLFELEDQRNWTDASFKIYSTPLATPRPLTLDAGQALHQEVRLTRGPVNSPATRTPAAPPVRPRPTRLSALLTTATPDDLAALHRLGVDAVRIELHPDQQPELARADDLARLARAAGLGIEFTLWCDERTDWTAARRLVDAHQPELVIVLPADARGGEPSEQTSATLIAAAVEALPGTRLGGGTPFNLCELQRHPLDHLATLTCSLTPTVHATDRLSVLETATALPDVVRTLRARAPHAGLALGPFQGRERRPTDPPGFRPGIAELPPDWLSASLAGLLQSGVERLCVADLSELIEDAAPTAHGRAVANARRGS